MAFNNPEYNPTVIVNELTLSPESGSISGINSGPFSDNQSAFTNSYSNNIFILRDRAVNAYRYRSFAFSVSNGLSFTSFGASDYIIEETSSKILDFDFSPNRENHKLSEFSSIIVSEINDTNRFVPSYIKITAVPGNWNQPPFRNVTEFTLTGYKSPYVLYTKQEDILSSNLGLEYDLNPSFVNPFGTGAGLNSINIGTEDSTSPKFRLKIGNSEDLEDELYGAVNFYNSGIIDFTEILTGSNFMTLEVHYPERGPYFTGSGFSPFILPDQTVKGIIEIF